MKKVRSIDASDGYQPDGIFLTVLAVVVARASGGGGGGNGMTAVLVVVAMIRVEHRACVFVRGRAVLCSAAVFVVQSGAV